MSKLRSARCVAIVLFAIVGSGSASASMIYDYEFSYTRGASLEFTVTYPDSFDFTGSMVMTTSRDILPYIVVTSTTDPEGVFPPGPWVLGSLSSALLQDSGGPGVDDVIDPGLSEGDDNISLVFSALSPNGVAATCKFGTTGGRCDENLPFDQFPDAVLYSTTSISAVERTDVAEPHTFLLLVGGVLGALSRKRRK